MPKILSVHDGFTDAKPEEVGYDAAALVRLDRHYAELIEKGTIQAAGYLLAKNGQVIAHRTMGALTPADDSLSLMPDSVRKVYSITKVFVAVAIHQLIDRGLLHSTQRVSDFIPEFDTDTHRAITITHLLTHTSGLRGDPGFYQEPYGLPWYEWWSRVNHEYWGQTEWIKLLLSGPLQNEPGKEWIYCSAGFVLLAEVVSRVSGKPFEQYVIDEITAPLNMTRTCFEVPTELYDEVCYVSEWEGQSVRDSRPFEGRPPRGGNGLYSTLSDLWRFGQMMLQGGTFEGVRIQSKRAVELQTANHLHGVVHNGWGSKRKDFPHGLGWSLDAAFDLSSDGTYSHEGYGHSGLYIDPAEQLVFVFFVPSTRGYTDESVVTPRAIVWSGIL
ncbi:CubicO group peptidase (beta-lactamase class C family) [Paenibacillus phyllosphaerae]|uniref:CubicO group peptidase (Beta-lactamase class C family) n=1 Tax=Paenibacillus phyllosphaerae TaxID=274593 RepID=A0A7W5B230_9BACL|nr:serine hydrolase domain-containing protein [Paenibacillus phyllosphaerae]MBB3112734.1 CubicO group peptidase (beta-lactamase class C family) [Paenibacillus phyllosphaerae]